MITYCRPFAIMKNIYKYKTNPNASPIGKIDKVFGLFVFGRGRRIRTLDLRFWRPLFYQLNYTPVYKY